MHLKIRRGLELLILGPIGVGIARLDLTGRIRWEVESLRVENSSSRRNWIGLGFASGISTFGWGRSIKCVCMYIVVGAFAGLPSVIYEFEAIWQTGWEGIFTFFIGARCAVSLNHQQLYWAVTAALWSVNNIPLRGLLFGFMSECPNHVHIS